MFMSVAAFRTDVNVFIDNAIICLTIFDDIFQYLLKMKPIYEY